MNDQTKVYVTRILAENEERARLQRLQQEVADLERLAQLRRARPIHEQITLFMKTLSPAQRDQCWSMSNLLPHLTGKYRKQPHAKEVGQALRRLGWCRKRLYAGGYDGARMWCPPQP
jgi:hypothetical protein